MCGIAGLIVRKSGFGITDLPDVARAMTSSLRHRGPDGGGVWDDQEAGVALGHRRLAILDLTEAGRQPMTSRNDRFVVVYNGEIYNYLSIRKELEARGHFFESDCDTEVLLASIVEWGMEAVSKFIGMFAFALWDADKKKLHLVRDRLGIKPLFYGWNSSDGAFLFGSELKAFHAYPGFRNDINLDTLGMFFRHNYIPAPYTIYKDVFKVLPGQVITISPKNLDSRQTESFHYWSATQAWSEGAKNRLSISEEEAVILVEEALLEAVKVRLISHVPLGAFLSGGVDSSMVTALMQATSNKPVKTFTIGFGDADYDEAPYAKAIATHLGTDHTELYVEPKHALELVTELPNIWDEPFADSSQIPTYLISKLTRTHVTVALSGDGGDELFWGYQRYQRTLKVWRLLEPIPHRMKKLGQLLLGSVPDVILDLLWPVIRPIASRYHAEGPLRRISTRICELLGAKEFSNFYGIANSHILPYGNLCPGHDMIAPAFYRLENLPEDKHEMMSLLDIITYLPDDILTKVDRASMAVALEARVPILDHRVAELSFKLPAWAKCKDGVGKWVLRQVLYKYVPQHLVERPKMGFAVPLGKWLRGPLKQWANYLLNPDRLRREGLLEPDVVNTLWQQHLSGKYNHQYTLWNILMFQAWLEKWGA